MPEHCAPSLRSLWISGSAARIAFVVPVVSRLDRDVDRSVCTTRLVRAAVQPAKREGRPSATLVLVYGVGAPPGGHAVARNYNDQSCIPPLPDDEVVKVARSAWKYTETGKNRIGQYGAWLTNGSINQLVGTPYALSLIAYLQAHNGPNAMFWIADGLGNSLSWRAETFQKARRTLIKAGWIKPLTKPSPTRRLGPCN
jgi:hypothetical protein